jgi:hypothetical protein
MKCAGLAGCGAPRMRPPPITLQAPRLLLRPVSRGCRCGTNPLRVRDACKVTASRNGTRLQD